MEIFDYFLDTKKNNSSSKIINVVLEAIIEVLKCGQQHFTNEKGDNAMVDPLWNKGIVERIEELQSHPNESVYKKSVKILSEFFDEEDIFES